MKKLLVVLLILLAISTVCIYAFIPRNISVSTTETINVNDRWVFNYLMNKDAWKKWWPDEYKQQDSIFVNNGQQFEIDSLFYNAMAINAIRNNDTCHTKLVLLPVKGDEVQLVWKCDLNGTNNPVTRLKQYQASVALKQSFKSILSKYKAWLSVTENVYGFDIKPAKIIDTMLLAKRAQFKGNYPTPFQVDSLLKILRSYVETHDAKEDGLPMLHVVSNEPGVYEAQVALPVNKSLPETDALKMKWMFAGNAIVAKFKGGPFTIQKAYEACETYKSDHLKTSPAIPFQSMITNRVAEPDTSKWETIIYYPVN